MEAVMIPAKTVTPTAPALYSRVLAVARPGVVVAMVASVRSARPWRAVVSDTSLYAAEPVPCLTPVG